MSRTSYDWWAGVLMTPGKLEDWLKRQYHSEASAVNRIGKLKEKAEAVGVREGIEGSNWYEWEALLKMISDDEAKHAGQVAKLMLMRGLEPKILTEHRSKYFSKFQENMDTSVLGMTAVAAYAELTSLTRFQAIMAHPETPIDIRNEFKTILFEEEFHYAAFRRLAGDAAMERAKFRHQQGLQAVQIEA